MSRCRNRKNDNRNIARREPIASNEWIQLYGLVVAFISLPIGIGMPREMFGGGPPLILLGISGLIVAFHRAFRPKAGVTEP